MLTLMTLVLGVPQSVREMKTKISNKTGNRIVFAQNKSINPEILQYFYLFELFVLKIHAFQQSSVVKKMKINQSN